MQKATAVNFAQLLDLVAKAVPEMRIVSLLPILRI
jgi:tRNA-2-methylthio-N6-dimethylallyladenosine synthase